MKKTNRRKFIKVGVYSSLAFATPVLTSCFLNEKSASESSIIKTSKVAAIKGDDLSSMTHDAIDALGGIQTIISRGDKVFIKPNFVSFPWAQYDNCFLNGECTKPEIIIATTEECLKAGASEVIIGEGSHLPSFDWKYAVTFDNKTNLVDETKKLSSKYNARVSLACLETDSPGWVEVPSVTPHGKIAIPSLVTTADKVISLPVAKTHSWAQLSLATKNFIGITPLSLYAQLVDNTWWNRGSFDHSSPRAIGQVYLDIVKTIRPVLSIIDFSIGIEGNGPTLSNGGTTTDMKDKLGTWALIASTDIMSADASAARIMNHRIPSIKQLEMGFEMGLGEMREEAIEIIGEKLENLRTPWKPARLMG